MDTARRTIDTQVQFWALLGPSLLLLSLSVLLFKVSPHWYIPVSAVMGIPLCVKWHMKGMTAALSCLLLLTGVGYQNLELGDLYWHVGLALAMAFSFIILTLSWEEAQGLVRHLQLESESRLDNLALLDEKWRKAEEAWCGERREAEATSATLSQELEKVQEDRQTFYKLAQLARDELVHVRAQHDQLVQEVLYKKQQFAQLSERLDEAEETIQEFVDADAEKKLSVLVERLTLAEKETQALQIAKNSLEEQLKEIRERLWVSERKLESSKKVDSGPSDGNENIRCIEAMYNQLKGQFEEKRMALDDARRELFHSREALLARQKEESEEQLGESIVDRSLQQALLELERQYAHMERLYEEEIDGLKDLVAHLLKEMTGR